MIKDELKRKTDFMHTVADGQAQGQKFDKYVASLQVLLYDSAHYEAVMSLMLKWHDEKNTSSVFARAEPPAGHSVDYNFEGVGSGRRKMRIAVLWPLRSIA